MSENEKNKKTIDRLLKDKKFHYVLIVIFSIIAIFVLLFGFNNEKESDQTVFNSDNYVSALENRLSKTLSEVDGAGKVSVIITVESGMETIIATEKTISETNGSKETVESPIIVNGKTVVLKELYPKISGVVIVAEGADNIAVMQKIQQATVSLLDVELNRIEILTMK